MTFNDLETIKTLMENLMRRGKRYEGTFQIRSINQNLPRLIFDTDFVITHILKDRSHHSVNLSEANNVSMHIEIGNERIHFGNVDCELYPNFFSSNGKELAFPIYINKGETLKLEGGFVVPNTVYHFIGFIPVKEKSSQVKRTYYVYSVEFENCQPSTTYTQTFAIIPKHNFMCLRLVSILRIRNTDDNLYVCSEDFESFGSLKITIGDFSLQSDAPVNANCFTTLPSNKRDLLVPVKMPARSTVLVEYMTPAWSDAYRRDFKLYFEGVAIYGS
ncbi:MAG: hypothetical protein QXO40_00280 [Candidatus Aenigmatarchaeota archaeon]